MPDVIGSGAGLNLTTGSNNIDIANPGLAADAGKIRIGTKGKQTAAFLQGVSGKWIPGLVKAVVINASGRLGTRLLSGKLKQSAGSLSARVSRLSRAVRRQAEEIRQLRKEMRASR